MIRRALRWVWSRFTGANMVILLTAPIVGVVVGIGIIALDRSRPAEVVTDLHETDGLAVQGGRLNILIGQDKVRDCPTVTARFLWRLVSDPDRPGQQIVFQVPLNSPAVPPIALGKDQRVILSLPLPSDIKEGDGWHYQSKSMRDCGLFPPLSSIVITQSPSLPIRILTAREAEGMVQQEGTIARPDLRP